MKHYAIFSYARGDENFNSGFVELNSRKMEDLIYPDLQLAPYCYQIKVFDSAQLIEVDGKQYAQQLNLKVINIGEVVHYHKTGMFLHTQSGRLSDDLKTQYFELFNQKSDNQYILKAKYSNLLFLVNKTDWLLDAKRIDEVANTKSC